MESNDTDPIEDNHVNEGSLPGNVLAVTGLFQNWFLDYASYVILERAVPDIADGLKPVQRRILHAMKEMDDGRFNKVANIIGQTMQYHPHGDAAIADAIVALGQKELLIDTQGNWGDVRTGDNAAAPRYIEARLTPFALEVLFNSQTTTWVNSYDGRKKEPLFLPAKFPLVLAQGVEGIAVGLATKIMPHNFKELCQASIDLLKGKHVQIYPDFPTGGMVDVSNYNEGKKGSKIRVRAKIEQAEGKRLLIKEIPYYTTTGSLIDSILKANENGKIKIKKVVDNTAKNVEIEIQLATGVSPEMTIDALYAFTDCEVSISPNCCVIIDDKPHFISINEILKISTAKTVELLQWELEIKRAELNEKWHFSSLEKIFIEERIYRDIEECETWEQIIQTIDLGLQPHKHKLKRDVTTDDITKLTEIRIKRISRFDSFKADELLIALEKQLQEVQFNLDHIVDYAIHYFDNLLKKYGKGKERRTDIRLFDTIEAHIVAVANEKLYANFAEGFVGTGLKKDHFICDCSDIDDIIAFRKDGKYMVSKVSDKQFMGKDLIHVDVFRKNDDRKVYNIVYLDGKSKVSFVKRFSVPTAIRDKEYDLTLGHNGSKILYFTANENSEAEKIGVYLSSLAKAKNKFLEFDFSALSIKGRTSKGNTLTKHPIRKIELTEKGVSTERGREIYFESEIGRLNIDNRGEYLGVFTSEDKILAVYKDGTYELTDNELTNKYDGRELLFIQKYYPSLTINAVHYDPDAKSTLVKRFKIETATLNRKFSFISDGRGAKLWVASTFPNPEIEFSFVDGRGVKQHQKVLIGDFIDVKGWKAMGNKLTQEKVKSVKLCSPLTHIPEVDSEETWNDNSNDPISPEEPVLKAPPPPEKKDFPPFMPKIEKEKQKTKNLDDDGTDTLGQKTLF